MSAAPTSALQGLLAAEHLAVHGYGLVGARLEGPALAFARECEQTHRARRDSLGRRLGALGLEPVPAEAGYDLAGGGEVSDAAAALALATAIEEQVATAQAVAVAASTETDVRERAVVTVADAAVRAARWRTAAGRQPSTVAFPGRS